VEELEELDAMVIATRLLQVGGAHKPTHYEFGPDEVIATSEMANMAAT
jgi:hypothetical protein